MASDKTFHTKQGEILVVDDTPSSLQLLTGILTDQGYRVRPASGGRVALRSAEVKVPDLILLDVNMPGIDGYEVCRRLKTNERTRDIPVIFISAYEETVRKIEGFNAGGIDYITKPFEAEEVLARIRTQLRLRELTEHLEQKVSERTEELTRANRELRREIIDRQRAEEERTRLEQQFYQAQKLESIGRLAGGVAHDLNNLLTPILGYGQLLLADAAGIDPRRKWLEAIVKAGNRMQKIVRQLLACSRSQPLEFTPVDLNSLLENFEKLLRPMIREDVVINMIMNPSVPLIEGDVGRLEQILMNMAVNAQDAMPDGGELIIETARVEWDDAYAEQHEGVIPGYYVMLAVSDTGYGMDEKTKNHLFEPFFTTKEKGKGTGLGLATVYGIVKQHDGHIRFYSEPGKGTTFKVYFPVSSESSGTGTHVSVTPSNLRGSETILLVEDDELVRELAQTILIQQGYAVFSAGNGTEALAVLNRRGTAVHLLLTDVIMPDMNGRELFDRVSSLYPDVRVLYMSGYTGNVIAHRGVVEPGVHFIQKPFSVIALAARVREVLDGK